MKRDALITDVAKYINLYQYWYKVHIRCFIYMSISLYICDCVCIRVSISLCVCISPTHPVNQASAHRPSHEVYKVLQI